MASRFNNPNRDTRSSLFSSYDSRAGSRSPISASRPDSGYGYPSTLNGNGAPSGAFSAYPSPNQGLFRSATPNSKGQYSDAVLSELESQNDEQLGGALARVKALKELTVAIGDEIRDSSALAEKMNEHFDDARIRLRGTMKRMLRMADRSGIGWKLWLAFFAAVALLFWYVWLF
ncbi:v-SNARE [Patellaria atrata CBS 101060]|uniref:V-SNARE n=1 Tax=Patellaria atrata CBS 101060 TaxID=1346257 RepID=A0A9P4VSF8_9PEZI|nr:v-SNARE [Patellaria atrata CBS 101060]